MEVKETREEETFLLLHHPAAHQQLCRTVHLWRRCSSHDRNLNFTNLIMDPAAQHRCNQNKQSQPEQTHFLSQRTQRTQRQTVDMCLTCSKVQRCGLPPRRVPAVHVLGRHQFADSLQVSTATGLKQLPAELAPSTWLRPHHGPRGHGSAPETGHSRTSPSCQHGGRRAAWAQSQAARPGQFGVRAAGGRTPETCSH